MSKSHHLTASADACHWGYFDATRPAQITIASGDEVTIDTLTGPPEMVPPKPFHTPPELFAVHEKNDRFAGAPHILTGPVAVEGAEPGDVLQVDILDIKLRQDWGFNLIRPLGGTLPDEFPEGRILNIPLDAEKMIGRLPFGVDIPLKPFFGIMGVAPPKNWGAAPRSFHAALVVISTISSLSRAQRCIFPCMSPARISPAAMGMARKAMARFA
jgi:acetamidase/formamidase